MELLLQQVMAGLATGGIYACMALAVVMIYQAIDHLNFAQGEMAMFSTFIAWQLIQWGVPYWGAFVAVVAVSFVGGIVPVIGEIGATTVVDEKHTARSWALRRWIEDTEDPISI